MSPVEVLYFPPGLQSPPKKLEKVQNEGIPDEIEGEGGPVVVAILVEVVRVPRVGPDVREGKQAVDDDIAGQHRTT